MSKFSAEELSSRINDLEIDDDVKISLMEDITDSISKDESEELATLKSELDKVKEDYESLKEDYESLKEKYKSRFFEAVSTDEEKKDDEELKEEEVIDIKEI